MNGIRGFLALSVMVAMIGGLAACTTTRERITEERTVVPQEEAERPVGAEEEVGVEEQPTAQQVTGARLQDLRQGQPVSYYVQQFERMGYQVQDVDYQDDRIDYELSKDGRMQEVSLMRPEGQNRVQRVQVQEPRTTAGAGAQPDQATQRLTQQIQQIPTGKKPEEYVPMLDRYGTVTDYRLRRDEAVIQMEANNRRYRITMDVNPSTQNVTSIEVDRRVWDLPG